MKMISFMHKSTKRHYKIINANYSNSIVSGSKRSGRNPSTVGEYHLCSPKKRILGAQQIVYFSKIAIVISELQSVTLYTFIQGI